MADETFELTNNLENLLSPFCYEPETALPKTIPEVPGGMYLSGFISQDCTWGCCFNHAVIKCFPVDKYFEDSHTSFAAHSSNASVAVSSSSYNFTGGNITCAAELAIHNLRTSSGMRKLLLGISYTGDKNTNGSRGAVVLFDPIRCAPMKWIEIPDPVSSIAILSHFEEGGSNRPFFNETMMAMVGIAAVGLRGGAVIIIDLGLDDPNLCISSTSDSKMASELTYRLLYVNPHEYVIATKRHKAVSKRSLIALRFTNEPEDEIISEAFHYCKPSGESMLALHKNSVAVTCLEYIPAIGSLLVGFTCGGFQMWRVNNMELQFSSEPVYTQNEEPAHVFGFSFQQPIDDPKNYCYIWVMYGNKSVECTSAHIELHSLYYERKKYIENFGFVYEGFRVCAKRMSFQLLDDFLSTDSENEDLDNIRCSARPIRIWTQPDTDLMYCTWEVGRGGMIYVGAFDLNQWYSNHTKEHIFYNPDSGLCPYWVALPVEVPDPTSLAMDVRIIPKSLMRWENPHAKLDVHLYPASVSFRAICLTNNGVSAFEHFGVQEKLTRIMLKDGPTLLIQPENIKNSFMRYGLEPVFPHVYGEHRSKKDHDRFFVLSVLLENRRIPAILRLADVWLDGSYANVGCTIDLMIDWIAEYMLGLRGSADEHWQNLFHFADATLPPETVRFINFSNFTWTSLHCLLLKLMGPTEVYTVRKQELECMEFGLEKLVQYSAALLMMYKAQLLPEQNRSFINNVTAYYEQRRHEAKMSLENCQYFDEDLKKLHPLMIDHLMDNLMTEEDLREKWHVKEGQHIYPPQHIGYLVNLFMLPDVDPKAVSRVFMYFLFDLSFFSQNTGANHESVVERKVRGDFKAVMDSIAEEYQDIYVLWLQDHGILNEILVHLKENDRLYQKDGLPWCAAAVMLTAAGYENDVAELLLKSCPHDLAKLLFSLMTSSVSKYTSLAEVMITSNLNTDEKLLEQFFEISENRERLAEFIRTKSKELPDLVKNALLAFLNKSDSVKRLSQLLMYYVHTEDYKTLEDEFARIREILRHRNLSDSDRKMWRFQETYISHLISTTKGSIVQQFLRRQSHQSVRSVQRTISIRAVPEKDDTSSDGVQHRIPNEAKLPPYLRRLKFSESVVQDPLSPLRRYAGRIQSAVAPVVSLESNEDKTEIRSKRLSIRKSFSRRVSLSISRHSLVNGSSMICNDTLANEDKLDITSRNCSIDLDSLLKTPSVDHRVEIRQSTNISLNQIQSREESEEGTGQPAEPLIHSIMKETDPCKPKVAKKVEIRFEDLSLSDEGDEKNVSVYEDADDNFDLGNSLTNNALNDSCVSASESFIDENDTTGETNLQNRKEDQETDHDKLETSQHEVASSVVKKLLDVIEEEEISEEEINMLSEKTPTQNTESVGGQLFKTPLPVDIESASSSMEMNLEVDSPPLEPTEIEQQVTSEGKKKKGKSRSTTPDRELYNFEILEDVKTTVNELVEETSELENSQICLPTSQLVTPKTEAEDTGIDLAESQETSTTEIIEGSHNRRRKNKRGTSRSVTPETSIKIESDMDVSKVETGPEDCENKPKRKKKRTPSRSSTPIRECMIVDTVNETETEENRNLRRSLRVSRSRTPTREVEQDMVNDDSESRVSAKRSVRSTRSTTPTRELVLEVDPDESESISSRRSTRSTRSNTPTRELELRSESSIIKTPRRVTRASVTPAREVITEEPTKREKSGETKTTKKGSRSKKATSKSVISNESSPSIFEVTQGVEVDDVHNAPLPPNFEQGLDINLRRSSRISRSRTPTREIASEKDSMNDTSEKEPARRTLRATRSTTPTREMIVEDVDESESVSSRRSTRSTRSKTPTRELEVDTQRSPAKTQKRGTRASITPSRDIAVEENIMEDTSDIKKKGNKNTSNKSVTATEPSSSFIFEITQEDMQQEEEDEEPAPTTSKKITKISGARKRRLKYLQHYQDLSTVLEDPSTTEGSETSVFEATIVPTKPPAELPKRRRIKGIKARTVEEETEKEDEPVKPTKRRKSNMLVDFDEDEELEVQSQVSSRSTRSASSRQSTGSTKTKTSRRKARSSSKSVS